MYDRRREGTEAVFWRYYAVFIGILPESVAGNGYLVVNQDVTKERGSS